MLTINYANIRAYTNIINGLILTYWHWGKGSYVKLKKTEEDYKVLLHLIDNEDICLMEATGNYHINLANYLICRNIRETLASKGLMLLEWLKKPRFYTKKLRQGNSPIRSELVSSLGRQVVIPTAVKSSYAYSRQVTIKNSSTKAGHTIKSHA
jgi:hypothetical protein